MMGTPGQFDPTKLGATIPISISIPQSEDVPVEEVTPLRQEEVPRRVYIKLSHLEKCGFTDECETRRRMESGVLGGRVRPHSEACRKRIEKALGDDKGER